MGNLNYSEQFLHEALKDYLTQRGFGSFNKNDFEILVFQALLNGDLA